MNTDFRSLAKEALKRAKAELATSQVERIKYAALELRFAMEAVTYDRAQAFKSEISPEEYKTWQPRKLMQVLHDIDPMLGMSASIAVGIEEFHGVEPPPEKMQFLGTDKVLTLADLKGHYDAVGNYLHVPSLAQLMKSGMPDQGRLRSRCEAVIAALEAVLASPVWNSTIGNFVHFECIRCKKPVRKRMPHGEDEVEVTCFECQAQYLISSQGDGQVVTKPKIVEVACLNDGSTEKMALWPDEVKIGTHWTCKGCGDHWAVEFGLIRATNERGPAPQ